MNPQRSQVSLVSPEQLFDVFTAVAAVENPSPAEVLDERRISERVNLFLEMEVQPLDDELQPIADPIPAMSRNMSLGGVAFFTHEPLTATFVRVRFPELTAQDALVIRVKHHRQIGTFYETGGNFRVDWSSD